MRAKRVMFCWELGAGLGHLVPHLDWLNALATAGHVVRLAVRDRPAAASIFDPHRFQLTSTPQVDDRAVRRGQILRSISEVYSKTAFATRDDSVRRVRWWQREITEFTPDLIVADHAPAALILAYKADVPVVEIGVPFCIPPLDTPFPLFSSCSTNMLDAAHADAMLLNAVNGALRACGIAQLDTPIEPFQGSVARLVLTHQLLAPIGGRRSEEFLGVSRATRRDRAAWPSHARRKALLYVSPRPGMRRLIDVLGRAGYHAVIVGRTSRAKHSAAPSHVTRYSPRINFEEASLEADVVLLDGGCTTVGQALRSQAPVLIWPRYLEQRLQGNKVEELGVGTVVRPPEFDSQLNAIESLRPQAVELSAHLERCRRIKDRILQLLS